MNLEDDAGHSIDQEDEDLEDDAGHSVDLANAAGMASSGMVWIPLVMQN